MLINQRLIAEDYIMKKFNLIVATVVITLGSLAVNAGPTTDNADRLLKAKMDCFRAHSHLMEKPSVKTLDACWREHSQMMK